MELYDKVDADVEFTPVDDTPQSWYNEGSKTPLMINAYSLAAETLEGTLDETYPVIRKISDMKLRPQKMKLSDKTLMLLKNFSTINQSILFKQVISLRRISVIKNILAEATIE